MRALRVSIAALVPVLLLSACAQEPLGPTIPVMPAPNKPFDVFQGDQALCKQYASNQVQGGAQQANNQQIGTAVVGTLLGAGLGAAIGGGQWCRDRGRGRCVGRHRCRGGALGACSGPVCSNATTSLTRSACIPAATRCRATSPLARLRRRRQAMRRAIPRRPHQVLIADR